MSTHFFKTIWCWFALCPVVVANAASISLVANTDIADVGDTVSLDIFMDFSTDTNGLGSDITIGGGFAIVFDSTALQFVSLFDEQIGDFNDFYREPEVSDGLIEGWGFGAFNGLTGPALVGTVQFSILPTAGASTFVGTAPTTGINGPFISALDFTTILDVDYLGANITVRPVPLPAAIWLLLGGVGVLSTLSSRSPGNQVWRR